jgi:protein-S-isoprenylcysteine O-methyltransferase Ste14
MPMEDIPMITSSLPLLFVVAAIVVLGVTGNLFSTSPFVIAAQVTAVGLNVWARISFQRGKFRVTAVPSEAAMISHGPYRFIRHPMYSAVLVFIWAGVASHLSGLTLTIGIAVTAVGIVRIITEERLLRAKYPEYLDYARSTKALIPYVF